MSDIHQRLANHDPFILPAGKAEGTIELPIEDFNQLVQLAHATVHPHSDVAAAIRADLRLLLEETEEDEPTYDEQSLRATAMHYSSQLEIARLSASHGLDSAPPDPVMQAEAILNFLKGGL